MSNDHLVMREQMLQRKAYLKSFYSNPPQINKAVINGSSDKDLRLLAKIMSKIANAEIPLQEQGFYELHRRKRLNLLKKTLGSKKSLYKFQNSHREDKIKFFYAFLSSFNILFFSLFNEK
jgi:hypothetical protein